MNDFGKIIFGLIVFLVLATFPAWYGMVASGRGEAPEVELPADETQCVESLEFMKANHMNLLDEWRDALVREGQVEYTSETYGDTYEISLTRTCLDCHSNKEQFCDKCHNYADVDPYCWDCHVESKGE